MTLCPSCGANVETDLRVGCPSCGARAIGPPLAKPQHQLTSYALAIIAFASGTLMLLAFLASLVSILVQNKSAWLQLSTIITSGEVAAWRLKWVALPVAVAVLWSSARSIRTIKTQRARFSGLRVARWGYANAIVTTLLMATLISVTVPERLRRHQWAVEAESNARWYTINSALLEYKALHGTYPSDPKELFELPDPYGTLAEALRNVDVVGYQPSTVLASASTKVKPPSLRGGALRNASMTPNVESSTDRGVTFTRYDWRLPGPDKIMFTDDDLILHDGVLMTVSELTRPATVTSKSGTP